MGSKNPKIIRLLLLTGLIELVLGANGNSGTLSFTFSSTAFSALGYAVIVGVAFIMLVALLTREKNTMMALTLGVGLVGGFFAASLPSIQHDLWAPLTIAGAACFVAIEFGGIALSALADTRTHLDKAINVIQDGLNALAHALGAETSPPAA